jgi:hypothetical protein
VLEQKVKTTQTQQQHKHTLLKTGKGISRQTFSSKPPMIIRPEDLVVCCHNIPPINMPGDIWSDLM